MASSPIISWQIGKKWEQWHFIFLGSKITGDGDCNHEIKTLAPWKKIYDKSRQYIKKQRHYFTYKGPSSQSYDFSSSHLPFKSWTIKKAEHRRIDALKLFPVPWTGKRSNKLILKEINWLFIGRTDAEAPTLWPPDGKTWLIGKGPDTGKDWRQKEKGATEDEMVGWHHWLNGHEFEQAPGDSEEQGSPACYSP